MIEAGASGLKKENTLNKLISYSWDSFSFGLKNKNVIHKSKKYNYKYVRSIDFYNNALEKIKKAPNINLYLGELIKEINKKKNNYLVYTQKNIYVTKNIIDTRPRQNIYLKEPFLFQSFLGYELEVKHHDSKFDTAKIMDDMRLIKGIFIFDYVLPFGKNKFLIEVTAFSESNMAIYCLQTILNNTLRKYKFKKYKIIRKEYGVIPMGFIDNNLISKKKLFCSRNFRRSSKAFFRLCFFKDTEMGIEMCKIITN